MRQVGVDWGPLTNGKQFEIFRRDISTKRPNEISLAEFSIGDVPDNEHPLKALSKTSINSGESRQIAEKIEAVQHAMESLRKNKESLAEDVTGDVTDIVGTAVSQQVEDEAKALIDELIKTLEKEAHQATVDKDTIRVDDESDDGEYVISLTQNGREIHRVSEDLQSEAVGQLVNYLIGERGLLDEIEIPYIPGTGKGSRALINNEPKHPNGSEMRGQRQVSGGYYLLTNLSSEDKKRYVSELPEKVGLKCEFSGSW